MFHVKHLRNLSARPQLVVDAQGQNLTGPTTDSVGGAVVTERLGPPPQGIPWPAGVLSPERLVEALPTNKCGGPVQLAADTVIADSRGNYLSDGTMASFGGAYAINVLGQPTGVWVHRLVYADKTRNTRRL